MVVPFRVDPKRRFGAKAPLAWTEVISFSEGMRVVYLKSQDRFCSIIKFSGTNAWSSMTFPINHKLVRAVANGSWSYLLLTSYSKAGRMLNYGYGSTLRAMIQGTVRYFWRIVELRGLGYKLRVLDSNNIEFRLGFSHVVNYRMPKGMYCRQLGVKNRAVRIMGPDLFKVAQTVEQIKALRAHSPYKLKGIFKHRIRPLLKEGYRQKL